MHDPQGNGLSSTLAGCRSEAQSSCRIYPSRKPPSTDPRTRYLPFRCLYARMVASGWPRSPRGGRVLLRTGAGRGVLCPEWWLSLIIRTI